MSSAHDRFFITTTESWSDARQDAKNHPGSFDLTPVGYREAKEKVIELSANVGVATLWLSGRVDESIGDWKEVMTYHCGDPYYGKWYQSQ